MRGTGPPACSSDWSPKGYTGRQSLGYSPTSATASSQCHHRQVSSLRASFSPTQQNEGEESSISSTQFNIQLGQR